MALRAVTASDIKSERAAFYDRLKPHGLAPLWEVLAALVTATPRTEVAFAKWSFKDIEPMLMEAGSLISAAEAERRVLILENPAMPGRSRITQTLYAGLQLILPGEVAPAHRHTQNALRFVMSGSGAFTALDGEPAPMHKHDLVLTPNWVWHDHGNETKEPMIWLDGLDIPLIQSLEASFRENRPDHGAMPKTRPAGDAGVRWGNNLRPARRAAIVDGAETSRRNPLFIYPFEQWRETLASLQKNEAPHPHDAYAMEFASPLDGGPVLTTISAFARLVPAGFETRPLRASDGTIMVVVEGHGQLIVDEKAENLAPGDIVVIPPWAERKVLADAQNDLVLFSYSDRALQEKLSLFRETLL